MFSASRPSQLAAVASAASAGGSSLAIRLVAGLGWAGLGVAAGLLLYQAVLHAAKTCRGEGGGALQRHVDRAGRDTSGTTIMRRGRRVQAVRGVSRRLIRS